MRTRIWLLIPGFACLLSAQGAAGDSNVRPPVSKVDLEIVRRAAEILNSPSRWNRADNRQCPEKARTFSLYCALEIATTEKSGQFEHRGAAMQEARFVIEDIARNPERYQHRLMDYNNDPTTTFTDVQKFFRLLEDRIAKLLAGEPVPVHTAAAAPAAPSGLPPAPGPVTEAELKVLARARALLDTPAKWNRKDNQDCPTDAKTISLFCAFRMASEEVNGRFDNSGAAIQEARALIGEMDPTHKYSACLTDLNNDPAITFSDIQKLFQSVQERLKKRLPLK
jgi:hypothetical protein